jgi:hypothetical protein
MNIDKMPDKSTLSFHGPAVLGVMLLLTAWLLSGCAAVALSAVGPAAEYGIDQATSGASNKTYTASLASLRLAALKSLSRMDMDVTKDDGKDGEWEIEAEAGSRSIDIELAALTANTTRIHVTADRGDWFFKDEATAEEVVAQITDALQRDTLVAEQAADTGDEP